MFRTYTCFPGPLIIYTVMNKRSDWTNFSFILPSLSRSVTVKKEGRKGKMPCGTIDIHPSGRRQLGTACMGLSLLQCLLGVAILGSGIHYLCNLHWKLSVVHDHNTYSLGFMILMTGSALSFVHLCTAKILYDSGRDETRRRFEFLLFPTVVAFGVFLIFHFSLLIACKVHRDYDLEFFREGFLVGITKYSVHSDMKVHMDRLQSKDQCCGADNFMDWIETDWVAPQFNPLSDPNMDFRAKSLYWPWSLLPPVRLDLTESREEIASNYEPPAQKVIPDSNSQMWLSSGSQAEPKSNQPVTFPPLNIRMPRRLKRSGRLGDARSKARDKANRMSASARMESYSQRFPPYENREHLSVVPWSCCSVDYYGPCVHDYVTQRMLTRELGVRDYWNGESLSQQGCAPLLQAKYKSYSQACLVLFSIAFPLQVLLLVTARYMQTCVENIDMYNREDGSAPGYLIPCSWFGGVDFKSIAKHKLKPSKPFDNIESPSEKDETSVSLLDEFDKLKQKKRRKKKQQLKNLLIPKSRRHSESQGSDHDSQGSENEAPVKPPFQSRRNSNDIDALEMLVPASRRKSRRIQVDERDFSDKIVTNKGHFIPNKIMKAGKRLFGTPAHEKRMAHREGEWSHEPERPLLDDDDRSPEEERSKRKLRVPSPKNLYRKLKKGTKLYLDKQSRSGI